MDTLRRGLAAVNQRDRATWLALCPPELENVPPRDWPESSPIQGAGAVFDFFLQGNEPWDKSALEYTEFIDGGNDTILAHVQGEMRGRASGAGVPWSFWSVNTFRDEGLVRIEWFANRADALRAADISE